MGRLRVWSDSHCMFRLCGSVAKTLLVLSINKNCHGTTLPSCLEKYSVEERTFARWSPEQSREDHQSLKMRTNPTTKHICQSQPDAHKSSSPCKSFTPTKTTTRIMMMTSF